MSIYKINSIESIPFSGGDVPLSDGNLFLSSYAKKRAEAVYLNLKKFFTSGPIDLFATIDMTFPDRPSAAEASKRFHSFWTNILSPYFHQYIRILEGHSDGSPHYHIAARTRGLDIRSGFNFQLHEEFKKIGARSDIPASENKSYETNYGASWVIWAVARHLSKFIERSKRPESRIALVEPK